MLFAIFIGELGRILNRTGLGIQLGILNISTIIFADDIVLIGLSQKSLDQLMNITRSFFKLHHLEISVNKTKIMVKDGPENIVFYGTDDLGPVVLKQD